MHSVDKKRLNKAASDWLQKYDPDLVREATGIGACDECGELRTLYRHHKSGGMFADYCKHCYEPAAYAHADDDDP